METQQKENKFVTVLQEELQKRIIETIKNDPSILQDNISSLGNIQIPIDELIKDQKIKKIEDLRSLDDLLAWDGQLVELTYMIQSMFDPELYAVAAVDTNLLSSENKNETKNIAEVFKYHETLTFPQSLGDHNEEEFNESVVTSLADRSIFYAIPIPSSSKWWQRKQKQQQGDISDKIEEESDGQIQKENISKWSVTYQNLHISSASDVDSYGGELQRLGVFNCESSKERQTFPCILKYYTDNEKQTPKLNQIVKVIGVLSFAHPHKVDEQVDGDEPFDPTYQHYYPEKLIPRIHVLSSKQLTYEDIYQHANTQLPSFPEFTAENTRELLLSSLTKVLGGDSQAAFYVLMALISSVNLKKDKQLYGKLVLNLTNAKQHLASGAQLSDALIDFLNSILLYSVTVPFTLDHFSNVNVGPFAHQTSYKIEFGQVQLPEATKHFVICDQTGIETGQLSTKGLRNVNHMMNLFQDLQVVFESDYFRTFVETDISGLILSGGKGVFHSDLQMRLLKSEEQPTSNLNSELLSDEGFLNRIRKYILSSKYQALTVQLNQEVAEAIQIQFVDKRKQQSKATGLSQEETIDQSSLERWIQLARLNAASKLKSIATIEDYQEIMVFEEQRIQRAVLDAANATNNSNKQQE